jgi:hypothetical protein
LGACPGLATKSLKVPPWLGVVNSPNVIGWFPFITGTPIVAGGPLFNTGEPPIAEDTATDVTWGTGAVNAGSARDSAIVKKMDKRDTIVNQRTV